MKMNIKIDLEDFMNDFETFNDYVKECVEVEIKSRINKSVELQNYVDKQVKEILEKVYKEAGIK